MATNIEIKELIELHMTSLRAEIKAGNDIIGYKLDGVNEHLATLNGRMLTQETKTDSMCKDIVEIQNNVKPLIWIKQNPLKGAVIFILMVAGIALLADKVGFEAILRLIKIT